MNHLSYKLYTCFWIWAQSYFVEHFVGHLRPSNQLGQVEQTVNDIKLILVLARILNSFDLLIVVECYDVTVGCLEDSLLGVADTFDFQLDESAEARRLAMLDIKVVPQAIIPQLKR